MKYLKVFTDFAEVVAPLGDAECGRLFKAMLKYAETGTEPDFNGNERFLWPAAKKTIDNQRVTYDNKVAGAEKSRLIRSDIKNNQNWLSLKSTQEKEKEKDKDNKPPVSPFEGELASAFDDWIAYKKERRETYKPTGLKSLITQIENSAKEYGDSATAKVIRDSMASGYRGIVFDRLKKGAGNGRVSANADGESACGYHLVYDN